MSLGRKVTRILLRGWIPKDFKGAPSAKANKMTEDKMKNQMKLNKMKKT